jgi:hypothetical protein
MTTILSRFGNQLELALLRHLERSVNPKVPIQDQIGQREERANADQQRANQRLDTRQFGRQVDRRFGCGGAAFRSTGLAFGGRFARSCGGFGLHRRFFRDTPHDLLDRNRKGATLFGADQREGEERQPGNRFAIQRGKEAIQARGVLAGFGDDGFITAEEIDILGVEEVRASV